MVGLAPRRKVGGSLPDRLRFGETDRIPIPGGNGIWFLVLDPDGFESCFTSSSSSLRLLAERLRSAPPVMRVYAVWTGQHRTDLFDCDPQRLLERIEALP